MTTTDIAVTTMKVARISKPRGGFEIVEREIPTPEAGQVRIQVQAALVTEGLWPGIQYPRVPGHEVAGIPNGESALMNRLDIRDATMVGHSTGGGEVVRYIARHGQKRVAKVVLISAVPPLMLKTDKNPGGLPLSVFDEIRAGVVRDRSQFFKDLSLPFYGYNKPGAAVSEGVRNSFWLLGMQSSVVGSYDCIQAFSETDQTEDLKKIDVPVLVIQGDADQIVPIDDSGRLSSRLVKNGSLKVIPGAPHGLCTTHADAINEELLAFLQKPRMAA